MTNIQQIIYAGELAKKHAKNEAKLSKAKLLQEFARISSIIEFYSNEIVKENQKHS